MGSSGEPSHLFLDDHSTNHKIRWNQGNIKPLFPWHTRWRHRGLPQPRQPCAVSAGRWTAAAGPAGWCGVTGCRRGWGCSGGTAARAGRLGLRGISPPAATLRPRHLPRPRAPRRPRQSSPQHGAARQSAAWTCRAGWDRVGSSGVFEGKGLGKGRAARKCGAILDHPGPVFVAMQGVPELAKAPIGPRRRWQTRRREQVLQAPRAELGMTG